MSRVCPKCGKVVGEDDIFCLSCGEKMTKTTHEVSQAFFTIRSMIKFSTIAYVVVGVILGYITGAYVAALWQDSSHISIHRLVCAIVGGCAGYLLVTAKMMVVKLLLIIAENTQ